jgi:ATP-dependent Clp protease ATP-binding subunit ClpC
MALFDRFTERARQVIVRAQQEARTLDHDYIGTEHLLLGLFDQETEDGSYRRLPGLDLSPAAVRSRVLELVGRGEHPPSGKIPFTPRSKLVLELSLAEATRLGSRNITSTHLLLGLIAEGGGLATQVMTDLGADLEEVRERIVAELNTGTPGELGETGQPGLPAQLTDQLERIEDGLATITRQLAAIQHQMDQRRGG